MINLNLLTEAAALGGYSITSGTGQDAINKARAQRRINIIKADIISRYGGKWDANYKEGWLPLAAIYSTGTASFDQDGRNVFGTGTTWDSSWKNRKILGADGAWYNIASVQTNTSLTLTQPYQGADASNSSYMIWKDEYRLYPEALTIGGFLDYSLAGNMQESWPRNMKDSYTNPSAVAVPNVYAVIGRDPVVSIYSTGTVSAAINTATWTGVGTSWLANIEPGMTFIVGAYTYHVKRVNSDTELETYQLSVIAVSGLTYVAKGKNALIVRFKQPTNQRIVSYWYWAKDYPFVNDNDEDWIAESYPKVLLNGLMYYDYMDKNDPIRTDRASMAYENSIKDMKVAIDNAFTGPRTLGYFLPSDARE